MERPTCHPVTHITSEESIQDHGKEVNTWDKDDKIPTGNQTSDMWESLRVSWFNSITGDNPPELVSSGDWNRTKIGPVRTRYFLQFLYLSVRKIPSGTDESPPVYPSLFPDVSATRPYHPWSSQTYMSSHSSPPPRVHLYQDKKNAKLAALRFQVFYHTLISKASILKGLRRMSGESAEISDDNTPPGTRAP